MIMCFLNCSQITFIHVHALHLLILWFFRDEMPLIADCGVINEVENYLNECKLPIRGQDFTQNVLFHVL